MTINNCNFNPYPTSNSLNSTLYGNSNSMWNQTAFKRCSQDTPVPDAKPFSQSDKDFWDSVRVPNGEDVPMGREGMISMMPQFNKDLFQCPDGTIISKSTGRILRDNTKNTDLPGSKLRMINNTNIRKDWDDKEIMDFDPVHPKEKAAGLNKTDIEYQEMSRRENERLKNNMNDLQKKLMSDLESGKLLRLSKLVDENR